MNQNLEKSLRKIGTDAKNSAYLMNSISSEQKRVNLLKEYKQSLISEVVTGKIRVTEDMI